MHAVRAAAQTKAATTATAVRRAGWLAAGVDKGTTAINCSKTHWSEPVEARKPMEVEVKIRLPNKDAYDRVAQVLQTGKKATFQQENYFFDGAAKELESRRAVMRLRFYDTNKKAVITVKGKQILRDGIGTASEVEESVPSDKVETARTWLQSPNDMLAASPLLTDLNKDFNIKQMVYLGGFRNTRTEFDWEGLLLELDETHYDWGTLYEIECETTEPEKTRDKLESLLSSQGIQYSYSKTSKFANFINRTLL